MRNTTTKHMEVKMKAIIEKYEAKLDEYKIDLETTRIISDIRY